MNVDCILDVSVVNSESEGAGQFVSQQARVFS